MNEEKEIRFIDLFGGVGGFRLGLEKANQITVNSELRSKHSKRTNKLLIEGAGQFASSPHFFRCVWYCDKDRYAVQVYNKNFKESHEPTDIRGVKTTNIPDFDFLVAGFPCQSFSIAGKRKGFNDTRGTLFFEIARILRDKRPRCFLLENVKGLLSTDSGKTFQTILRVLSDIGYRTQWQVLNSKDFGVPQNRERVFIIGHLGKRSGSEILSIRESHRVFDSENKSKRKGGARIQSEVSPTIDGRYGALRNVGEPYIISNPHGFNKGGFKELPNVRLSDKGNEFISLEQVGNIDQKGHNSLWGRVYNPNGISSSLNAKGGGLGAKTGLYQLKNKIRRLTPIECERLQGFPDNWTKYGTSANGETIAISDTQRYKMCGNAVTVNVIEAIGKEIYKTYKDQTKLDTKEVQ